MFSSLLVPKKLLPGYPSSAFIRSAGARALLAPRERHIWDSGKPGTVPADLFWFRMDLRSFRGSKSDGLRIVQDIHDSTGDVTTEAEGEL